MDISFHELDKDRFSSSLWKNIHNSKKEIHHKICIHRKKITWTWEKSRKLLVNYSFIIGKTSLAQFENYDFSLYFSLEKDKLFSLEEERDKLFRLEEEAAGMVHK